MTIAILATGDEITDGVTLNTNGRVIAETLSSDGLPMGMHLACRDNEHEIVESLHFLSQRHQIIVVIGGLGPTSDDKTRFALAQFLNVELRTHEQALQHIKERLSKAHLELNEGNRQQALFPEGAILLPNPFGTALGCYYAFGEPGVEKHFILLPGPPHECLSMFDKYALPKLRNHVAQKSPLMKWRLFGIAEGMIGEILDNALKDVSCTTGYRLETPYVEFKVRCERQCAEAVKRIVEPIIAPFIIATPEYKASELLRLKIAAFKKRVVIVDEATGGVLQTLLQHPSTYPWVSFYENKEADYYFHIRGLEAFWQGTSSKDSITVIIDYRMNQTEGTIRHDLPYYSSNVVYFAAEWLSYRLLHLIDKTHQVVT